MSIKCLNNLPYILPRHASATRMQTMHGAIDMLDEPMVVCLSVCHKPVRVVS